MLETLRKMNSWWDSDEVPRELTKEYKKYAFYNIIKLLKLERIIVILGARRVGKTTLIHQIVEHLLKSVDAANLLYMQLDHPNLKSVNIEEVIELYKRHLKPSGRIFVFLDEVQYLKEWTLWLKNIYDRKENIKFVVSGSAASSVKKDTGLLIGRSIETELFPFKFSEFVEFKTALSNVDIFENIKSKDFFRKFNLIKKDIKYLKLKEKTRLLLNEFIIKGGFPETFEIKSLNIIQTLLREDVISKSIYRDIVNIYDVKEPALLESVLNYVVHNSSKIFNKDSLSKDLGISKVSLSNYLNYLKFAFLIYEARNYSKSIKKTLRTMSRYYVCDSGLINSITLYGNEIFTNETKLGGIVETMVFNHCFIYAKENYGKVFYWRDKQKNEVDIVLSLQNKVLPIEVKFKDKIKKEDVRGILHFLKKFKIKQGIVVTKNLLKNDSKLMYVPAWLFLMIV